MTEEEKKAYRKEYKEKNKEKIKAQRSEYRIKNIHKINQANKEWREANKEQIKQYRENNKENRNEYIRNKKLNDPLFNLTENIKNAIRDSFRQKGYKKLSKTEIILGCTFEDFKLYLESKFENWMNWENKGKYNGTLNFGWDIDHIKPLSSATNEIELLALNHYTNLQPLCSKVNRDIKRNNPTF